MNESISILVFGDTHLGYDLPLQPRIERRRRGDDFFSNYRLILQAARRKKVDLIVHGGDFFFRSKVPQAIVDQAYQALFEVAAAGIPIMIVPGNHERSRLPEHLFLAHDNIRIFDQPKTYTQQVRGKTIAFSGFPFARKVRDRLPELLRQTGWETVEADARFLCVHQTFEGARVGPVDFTFKNGPDNIPPEWVPDKFTAVLSGHIHRAQLLTQTLDKKSLKVPVIYPGSIERTSVAERFEEKSYQIMHLKWERDEFRWELETCPLPARPMVKVTIPVENFPADQILLQISDRLALLKPDAVVRVELTGSRAEGVQRLISASSLRAAAPGTMNISFGLKLGA